MHVARRLKLARVSPRLIEALQAKKPRSTNSPRSPSATITPRRRAAFFDAPDWARTPERLKAQVTQAHAPETDKLARFVGIDAYEAQGGAIVFDLFAETETTARAIFPTAICSRAWPKPSFSPSPSRCAAKAGLGSRSRIDGVAWAQFPERVRERRRELSEEERAEQDRLVRQAGRNRRRGRDRDTSKPRSTRFARSHWTPEEVALAGAIVTLEP